MEVNEEESSKILSSEESDVTINKKEVNVKEDEENFIRPQLIKPLLLKKKNILKQTTFTQSEEILKNEDEKEAKPLDEKEEIKKVKKIEKSPSQIIVEKETPIPYKEPAWSGLPPFDYSFEVIKNGVVIERIPFNKTFFVVGRLSNCDIIMEHPLVSRYHCVIQYRHEGNDTEPSGLYVYDLGSTHGTFQNKYRLKPNIYNRLRVGHMLKFGGSSRLFILQGPGDDQEPESGLTVTELMALANERKLKLQKLESGELDSDLGSQSNKLQSKSFVKTIDVEKDGIDWGIGEDAQEEDEAEVDGEDEDEDDANFKNPYSLNEELYLNDPKKTLRGWYEREGHDLPNYQVEEINPGFYRAKLELPLPPGLGGGKSHMTCSVEHRGKKKDSVVQCALEACRMLDSQGILRQATHESHERKKKNWSENDYYDSDEDDFLDRTGDIERKRKLRKKEIQSAKLAVTNVETYDTLMKQYSEVTKELDKLENRLKLVDELKQKQNPSVVAHKSLLESDELDNYMDHLSSQLPDKHKIVAWKHESAKLRKDEERIRKLVNLARPLGTVELKLRSGGCIDSKRGSYLKSSSDRTSLKRKGASVQKVHEAFLEEDEEVRPKLPKVNFEDDFDNLKPIPYSKPQNKLTKYRKLLSRENRLDQLIRGCTPDYIISEAEIPENSTKKHSTEEDSDVIIIQDKETTTVSLNDLSNHCVNAETPTIIKHFSSQLEEKTESVIAASIPLPEGDPKQGTSKFEKPSFIPVKGKPKTKDAKMTKKNPFAFEQDYESWIPPSGQTGDGRTALNDKFGY